MLFSFAGGSDGAQPLAGLAIDSKGALYGTTLNGGTGPSPGFGTVFQLTPPVPPATKWAEAVLHKFLGKASCGPDIRQQRRALRHDGRRSLLGQRWHGVQADAAGSSRNGPRPVLHDFTKGGPTDGANPLAGLILDSKGALYGTTEFGGKFNWGTVFKD